MIEGHLFIFWLTLIPLCKTERVLSRGNSFAHLSQVYEKFGRRITTRIEASKVYLSVNQAIPCALVLNELIANAFKHAFTGKKKGTVWISIKDSDDDAVCLKVKDDGDSIPQGIDFDTTPGIGLKLIRHLVEGQLKGKIDFGRNNGTEVCVEFRKQNTNNENPSP